MELARVRAPHLKAAVWQIVMNDCIAEELNLHEQETAGAGGIILESQGPYPMCRGILGAREQR